MQYAIVDNKKTQPSKGLRGLCISCSNEVVAKCGNMKVHHWAHKSIKDCDSWYEPETEWHRHWKNEFPEEFREISFTNPTTSEIHRADIQNSSGVTIEFQNSPITMDELSSRESFYPKLIWVVNGLKFKGGIHFIENIVNPANAKLLSYEFAGKAFYKKEDLVNGQPGDLYRIYGFHDIGLTKADISTVHFALDWKNQHKVWLRAKCPVFIDLGHNLLYWLRTRQQLTEPYYYIQGIKKVDFIAKYTK
jgi:competence protein CoiA